MKTSSLLGSALLVLLVTTLVLPDRKSITVVRFGADLFSKAISSTLGTYKRK